MSKYVRGWNYYYGNYFCIQDALCVFLFIHNYKAG